MNSLTFNVNNRKIVPKPARLTPFDVSELYLRSRSVILPYLRSKGATREESEDVLGEGVLILLEAVQEKKLVVEKDTLFYLKGICRNLWNKQSKKKGKSLPLTSLKAETLVDNEEIEELIRAHRFKSLVMEKFKELSTACQEALAQKEIQGNKWKEIAHDLEISYANARQLGVSCRNKLRKLIKQDPRYQEYK